MAILALLPSSHYVRSELDAARAYNQAARNLHGSAAKLNSLPEDLSPPADVTPKEEENTVYIDAGGIDNILRHGENVKASRNEDEIRPPSTEHTGGGMMTDSRPGDTIATGAADPAPPPIAAESATDGTKTIDEHAKPAVSQTSSTHGLQLSAPETASMTVSTSTDPVGEDKTYQEEPLDFRDLEEIPESTGPSLWDTTLDGTRWASVSKNAFEHAAVVESSWKSHSASSAIIESDDGVKKGAAVHAPGVNHTDIQGMDDVGGVQAEIASATGTTPPPIPPPPVLDEAISQISQSGIASTTPRAAAAAIASVAGPVSTSASGRRFELASSSATDTPGDHSSADVTDAAAAADASLPLSSPLMEEHTADVLAASATDPAAVSEKADPLKSLRSSQEGRAIASIDQIDASAASTAHSPIAGVTGAEAADASATPREEAHTGDESEPPPIPALPPAVAAEWEEARHAMGERAAGGEGEAWQQAIATSGIGGWDRDETGSEFYEERLKSVVDVRCAFRRC